MYTLENLKLTVADVDITDIVTSIVFEETIFGAAAGRLAIEDGRNFLEGLFDAQIHIRVRYEYFEEEVDMLFYVNGITDVETSPAYKTYNIHLISTAEYFKNFHKLNQVYEGTSTDMIVAMMEASSPAGVVPHSISSTVGKYIAPNINAGDAINTILNAAADSKGRGYFLFERARDNLHSHLMSVSDMFHKDNLFTDVKLEQSVVGYDADGKLDMNPIGSATDFLVKEDSAGTFVKIKSGMYGMELNELNLSDTSYIKGKTAEGLTPVSAICHVRSDMYDNNAQPILKYSQARRNTAVDKRKVFNKQMNVVNAVPIPGLSVGELIEVVLGSSNFEDDVDYKKRHDGNWLIAGISHRGVLMDGEYKYYTDFRLLRPTSHEDFSKNLIAESTTKPERIDEGLRKGF